MILKALDPSDTALHVALSSLELSALGIAAFDPEVLPAIRAGRRINTIDADDSGMLVHAVPLAAWPEALWRALAGAFVDPDHRQGPEVDLPTLYAARLVPDPADRSLLVSLTPAELADGLRATHPDAFTRKDRIAARIHCLDALAWSHHPIALAEVGLLSETGWQAAAAAMPDPDARWRWSPSLRRAARSTLDDAVAARRRARMRLVELHAMLHVACEVTGAGYDVDGYHDGQIAALLADPVALGMLRTGSDGDDDLVIVRNALDERGHRWREARDSGAAAAGGSSALAA